MYIVHTSLPRGVFPSYTSSSVDRKCLHTYTACSQHEVGWGDLTYEACAANYHIIHYLSVWLAYWPCSCCSCTFHAVTATHTGCIIIIVRNVDIVVTTLKRFWNNLQNITLQTLIWHRLKGYQCLCCDVHQLSVTESEN